jgi:Spy/CpxP family protein refolding chaperone
MNARHIILTIAALAILAAPAAVLAQQGPGPGDGSGPYAGGHGGRGMHGGRGWHGDGDGTDGLRFLERMLPRMAETLGLSDEQVVEIQAIADEARATIEEAEYLEQLRAEREAYRATNDDPRIFNEAAFKSHAAAMHQIQTEIGVVVGQAKADIFNVLTDEQLEQFLEIRNSFGRNSRRGGDRRPGN